MSSLRAVAVTATFLLSALLASAESPDETEILVKEFLTRRTRFTFDDMREFDQAELYQVIEDARLLADYTLNYLAAQIEAGDEDESLPLEYQYLIPVARYHYWLKDELVPEQWTISAFLHAFDSREEFWDACVDYMAEIDAWNRLSRRPGPGLYRSQD